jgi:type II secretory pathway component PulC
MKNRKLMYVLVPLVVAIWGTIVFRIFSGMKGENRDIPAAGPPVLLPGEKEKEDYQLIADYPDPFLNSHVMPGETDVVQSPPRPLPEPPPVKPPLTWPSLKYGGIIKNIKVNKEFALIQMSGKEYLARQGEMIGELQLLRIYKDSVLVSFQNEKRTIKK